MSVTNGQQDGPATAKAENGGGPGTNDTDGAATSEPTMAKATANKDNSKSAAGKNVVVITHDELRLEEIVRDVSSPTCGGTATFIGTTRNSFKGQSVLRLEYEGYESMARKSLLKICTQIREKWSGVYGIALVHRLGIVPVGEASVVIVVTSAHRQDALQAVEYGIDTLKARVPIWKKEYFADGNCEWKANCEGCTLAKNRPQKCGHGSK